MTTIGKDGPIVSAPQTSPTEPEEWTPWYSGKFKELQDWLKNYDLKKSESLLLPQKRLADANKAIHRGAETRKFLESEFWLEFLKPALSDEQTVKPWKPGDSTDHMAIVSTHLFASGKSMLAEAILKKFEEWIRIGDNAKKIVAEDVERRKDIGR